KDSLFRLELSESSRGTSGEKGSGLGLILCKEFIERHGGEIRVESQPGEGSRFIFTIPAVAKEQERPDSISTS
ncbi:MAG: ATP-binding protein, partial [Mariniphaga sp.]